ncbi:hypothetical protein WJX79_009887 [Trebouxia sp. C0005]
MSQNAIRQLLACSRPSSLIRYTELMDLQQPTRFLHGTAASITASVCQLVGSEQTAASSQWLQYGQRQAQRYSTAGHNSPKITPAVEVQLHRMRQRHGELCRQLADESAAQLTPKQLSQINKELSTLQPVVDALRILSEKRQEMDDLEGVLRDSPDDKEMQRMAEEEQQQLQQQIPQLEEQLLLSLVPPDETDQRDIVLEVRAGTGGDEAALFAGDLLRMYERAAALNGWKFEIVEMAATEEKGGCKSASATISGQGVYGRLKYESGIHRVQRVPATEASGRVHTSAASVAILPQADEVDIDVQPDDLRVDTYRASGAGGQHVNTTNSAVRITHIPSGLVVAMQDERSQHKNKAKALKVLRARLYDQDRLAKQQSMSAQRKTLVGSGDRSERIRTYNYPQGRVTDHRVAVTEHGIDSVMSGERLAVFADALQLRHQAEMLAQLDGQ